MSAPPRYPLGIDELLAFAERSGVRALRHATRREVALHARVADRDAPIIAAGSEDKKWVLLRMRLPVRVRDGAARAAELTARGAHAWTYDAERDALVVRAAVPVAGGVEYTDAAVAAVLLGLREEAERVARGAR